MSGELKLREAKNVADAMRRDALVRRMRAIREQAVESKTVAEWWNNSHANEEPITTEFEDAVIAWCDGTGPFPFGNPQEKA